MMRHQPPQHPGTKRPGQTLVMFVLLTPALLGMVGLTIDGGLMLVTHRQTQNAADTAALAAAVDLMNGKTPAAAQSTAQTYVQTYNNMPNATTAPYVNIPPLTGPHSLASIGSTSNNYAEAIISYPFQTSFIQMLGVNSSQQVTARAVAGVEGGQVFLVE
jgi:Flp pilus assembly protein TadG